MQHADDAVARALRSFAATIAGEAAHELGNRLATMRETVGLLEDLARAGKAGAAGTARAHASLDGQVGRGLNIVRALGGLGGALGSGATSFDVGAALGDLLSLTERWAQRESLQVEREIGAALPPAAGDPALFLCLLHRWLVRAAAARPAGAAVRLRAAVNGSRISVSLRPAVPGAGSPAAHAAGEAETDRELAVRLGGGLTLEGGGAATITLPLARETR